MTPEASILVVEDDAGIATLQRRRLERAGYRAVVATDVDTALSTLRQGTVDLVLMDYRLGTTTGLDLHGRMKAAGYNVPVVIVSGSMDDQLVIHALRAGIRDVIFKSTDYLDHLPEAVRGVLDQAAEDLDRRPQPLHEPARILIVEDDPGVALLQRRQLERVGHDVTVVATAEEAIEVVGSGTVAMMVLDLRLPGGVSGVDLYEQLKASGWNVPAILVTAFPDQSVAIRALRAGIRDFIPKTTDYLDYLPAAIDRIVTQVRVERKLVESELRLASIIGTATDAILMCDPERRILLFNRAAAEMFGCTADEAMGGTIDRFIPDLRLPSAGPAPSDDALRRMELDAIRATGTPLPVEVSISVVVEHDRRLFTVIARDITERRRIEAELRDADRRKDEFLGMLAHELRNPLAAITGAVEVLSRSSAEPRTRKLTDVVRRQTRILARMVDDLLDVSRVTLGKIRLSQEPLLLDQVASRAAESMRDTVTAAQLAFDVRIDPAPVWIHGDATRLEQVLTNLLNNAIKYTPAGGRVTLDARRQGEDGLLRVRDTGVGMEPSLVPRVFDLFVQGDTSLARSTGGLGIGLALVRQVVALHHGSVAAFSEGPGRGSEFVVRLPVSREDARPPAPAAATRAIPVRPLRVLVVDDQRDVADALSLLLEVQGHEVRTFYDGTAALAAAREQPPDVMFIDIGMPGMTGYEVADEVRRDTALAAVHLVALSGYGRDEDRRRALAGGFDRHLTKPIAEGLLEDVLAGIDGQGSG